MFTINLNQAVFNLFPYNNNRTAWRPVSFPIILTVPFSKGLDGSPIDNGNIYIDETNAIQISIEGAPDRAKVVGHTNIGRYVPDQSLYVVNISYQELLNRQISQSLYPIYDENFVETDDFSKAKYFKYTTNTGVIDYIEYIRHTTYYDLSDIEIPTEDLPIGLYYLKYHTNSYKRIVVNDQLVCIDTESVIENSSRILINHPGDVLSEFYYSTPSAYVEDTSKSKHPLVQLYRPFTDILQDIYDEQNFIENANWIYDCDEQMLPHIAATLGWDIPSISDNAGTRRALIRKITEIQKLKGSKAAIEKIYQIFGYQIFINWLDTQNKPVRYEDSINVDILLYNYYSDKFITLDIPLVFKPEHTSNIPFNINKSSDITIYAIAAKPETASELLQVSEFSNFTIDADGIITPEELLNLNIDNDNTSIVVIKNGVVNTVRNNGVSPPLSDNSIVYDKEHNTLSISINRKIEGDEKLFCYAIYNKVTQISEQTNKFIIQILDDSQEVIDQHSIDFINSLISNIKSYHSQLAYTQSVSNLGETYLVNDLCAGGDYYQRRDTDLGKLQVPQAIIPTDGCGAPEDLGYKRSDIQYRNAIINDVLKEFYITKTYDSRNDSIFSSNIPTLTKVNGTFSHYGQDIIEPDSKSDVYYYSIEPENYINKIGGGINKYEQNIESSTNSNSPLPLKSEVLSTSNGLSKTLDTSDFCMRGRVSDTVTGSNTILIKEKVSSKLCGVSYGVGVYYTFPAKSAVVVAGTSNPQNTSKTARTQYSGQSKSYGEEKHKEALIGTKANSYLGDLSRSIDTNKVTLHYSDRGEIYPDSKKMLALQRPSLDIQKPNMHLPGCRFPMYSNMETDYISTSIKARPWDSAFSKVCGPFNTCNKRPSYLNATITIGTDGNEYLIFDDVNYIAYGNGIKADIENYGDNSTSISESYIIHRIYSTAKPSHPAITLDQLDDPDAYLLAENGEPLLLENGELISIEIDNIETDSPLFSSALNCGELYKDMIDGYPSSWGNFLWANESLYSDATRQAILEGLGLTTAGNVVINSKFRYGSGIRISQGLRYDCGCNELECEVTLNIYDIDTCKQVLESDVMEYDSKQVNNERIGVQEVRYDGTIRTYFELIQD